MRLLMCIKKKIPGVEVANCVEYDFGQLMLLCHSSHIHALLSPV